MPSSPPLNCELQKIETVSDSFLEPKSALSTGSGPVSVSNCNNNTINKLSKTQWFKIASIYSPANETAGQLQLGSLVRIQVGRSAQVEGHLGELQAAGWVQLWSMCGRMKVQWFSTAVLLVAITRNQVPLSLLPASHLPTFHWPNQVTYHAQCQ